LKREQIDEEDDETILEKEKKERKEKKAKKGRNFHELMKIILTPCKLPLG
jgi:hypothetical protein